MKSNSFAILDNLCATVWARPVSYTAELAAIELDKLQELNPSGGLQLVRTYVGLDEVPVPFVDILTPWATAFVTALNQGLPSPIKAVIEVWHEKECTFRLKADQVMLDPKLFIKCATFLVPSAENVESALDAAYTASQNIDTNWRPGNGCRSSSVGDVFVVNMPEGRQPYGVASCGFQQVAFSNAPADASADLHLSKYRAEAYLRRLGAFEKVCDLYDDDEMLQGALLALIPTFEYPDWSHRTIGEVLRRVFPKP